MVALLIVNVETWITLSTSLLGLHPLDLLLQFFNRHWRLGCDALIHRRVMVHLFDVDGLVRSDWLDGLCVGRLAQKLLIS
jgi:hypothetical protein